MVGMETQPARPRRKYTVTEKVLAANRRNLEKARAVPKSIRYRPTERRLAACHANLEKARAARRAGCTTQGDGHGFQALDLRRSAGESFERLRATFLAAFRPANPDEERLAGAMAALFWRRWRALEWEARRGAERFYRRLTRGVEAERALGRERADAQTVVAIEALLAFSGLGELRARLGQLSRRFERLARAFLFRRTGQRPDFQLLARETRFEPNLLTQPEAALGNPFRSSGVVKRALKQREERAEKPLPEPGAWRSWGSGATQSKPAAESVSLPEDFNAHRERLRGALGLPEGNPTVQAALDRAAEASWQRLRRPIDQVEREQAAVDQILALKLEPRALAERLIQVLMGEMILIENAQQLEDQFKQALFDTLTAAEGSKPCFAILKPRGKQWEEIAAQIILRQTLAARQAPTQNPRANVLFKSPP
jgi:hypothetical protein